MDLYAVARTDWPTSFLWTGLPTVMTASHLSQQLYSICTATIVLMTTPQNGVPMTRYNNDGGLYIESVQY